MNRQDLIHARIWSLEEDRFQRKAFNCAANMFHSLHVLFFFFEDDWASEVQGVMWHNFANDNDNKTSKNTNIGMAAHGLRFSMNTLTGEPWRS